MAPWLAVLEAYLVQALLRTPAFHRGVEKVVKGVHRIRHGIPPEEMGGTKIDQPGQQGFLRHFSEEIQAQLGRAEARQSALKSPEGTGAVGRSGVGHEAATEAEAENAEAVWNKYKTQTSRASEKRTVAADENADAVWSDAQKRAAEPVKEGFMSEYMGALRDQLKNGK